MLLTRNNSSIIVVIIYLLSIFAVINLFSSIAQASTIQPTNSVPFYNSFGCLGIQRDWEYAPQNPPPLQFKRSFQPLQCDHEGTLFTQPYGDGVECNCKFGYTGLKCQFHLSIASNDDELPPNIPLNMLPWGTHALLTTDMKQFGDGGRYRFRFGYVNPTNKDQYVILPLNPIALSFISLEDSTGSGATTRFSLFENENFSPSVAPITNHVAIKLPLEEQVPPGINCLTLFAYEIPDDFINFSTETFDIVYEPIYPLTAGNPNDFNTIVPGSVCDPSTDTCICPDISRFGPNCQLRLINRDKYIDAVLALNMGSVPQVLYPGELILIEIEDIGLIKAGLSSSVEFTLDSMSSNIEDRGIASLYQVPNTNIYRFELGFPTGYGEQGLPINFSQQYSLSFSVTDSNSNTHSPPFELNFILQHSCYNMPKYECNPVGVLSCNIPHTQPMQCNCKPGYYGAKCQWSLTIDSIDGTTKYDNGNFLTSDVITAGIPLLITFKQELETSSQPSFNPEVTLEFITQSESPVFTHDDTSTQQIISTPYHKHFIFIMPRLANPALHINSDVIAEVKFTLKFSPDVIIEMNFHVESACETTLINTENSIIDGIAGCGRGDIGLSCNPGYFDIDCSQYRGELVPLPNNLPFYPGAVADWSVPPDSSGLYLPNTSFLVYLLAPEDLSQRSSSPHSSFDTSNSITIPPNETFIKTLSNFVILAIEPNHPTKRFTQLIGIFKVPDCQEIDTIYRNNIATQEITFYHPPCYLPHTSHCRIAPMLTQTYTQYCRCDKNGNTLAAGPQCQTLIQTTRYTIPNTGVTNLVVQIHTPNGDVPHEIAIKRATNQVKILGTASYSESNVKIDQIELDYSNDMKFLVTLLDQSSTIYNSFRLGQFDTRPICNYGHYNNGKCICPEVYIGAHCEWYIHIEPSMSSTGRVEQHYSFTPGEIIDVSIIPVFSDAIHDHHLIESINRMIVSLDELHNKRPSFKTTTTTIVPPVTANLDGNLIKFTYKIPSDLSYASKLTLRFADVSTRIVDSINLTFDVTSACNGYAVRTTEFCAPGTICPSVSAPSSSCRNDCRDGYYSLDGIDIDPCSRFLGYKPPYTLETYYFYSGQKLSFTCEGVTDRNQIRIRVQTGTNERELTPELTGVKDLCTVVLPVLESSVSSPISISFIIDHIHPETQQLTSIVTSTIHGNIVDTTWDLQHLTGLQLPVDYKRCTLYSSDVELGEVLLVPTHCNCIPNHYGKYCSVSVLHDFDPQITQIVDKRFKLTGTIDLTAPSGEFILPTDPLLTQIIIGETTIPYSHGSVAFETIYEIDPNAVTETIYISLRFSTGPDQIYTLFTINNISTCILADSKCHQYNTKYCDGTIGQERCICKDLFFGTTCSGNLSADTISVTFDPLAVSPEVRAKVNFGPTPALIWGYIATVHAPPSEFFDNDSTFSLFDKNYNLKHTFTSEDQTATFVVLDQEYFYLTGNIGTIADGNIPRKFVPNWTGLDECSWFKHYHNGDLTSGLLPCIVHHSKRCDLSQDVDICTCNHNYIDLETQVESIFFGEYCQYKITIPLGPYYIGQHITVTIENHASNQLDPIFDTLTFALKSTSHPDIILDIKHTKHLDVSNSVLYQQAQVYIVEITDTRVDTGVQPHLQLPHNVVGALDHFTLKIESSAIPIPQPTSQFRVVTPCYWTQIAKSRIICSDEGSFVGDSYEYTAVASCMDPDTHQIKCICKDGYYGSDCRLKATIVTPPIDGQYYDGQSIKLNYAWYIPSNSIHDFSLPESLFFSFNSQQPLEFLTKTKMTDQITFSSKRVPDRLNYGDMRRDMRITYFERDFYQKTLLNPGPLKSETVIKHPWEDLIHEKPIGSLIDGLAKRFDVNCVPDAVTAYGCACGSIGIFGPDCTFKIELELLNKPYTPLYSLYYAARTIVRFHLSTVSSPVERINNNIVHTLPQNFSFELRNECSFPYCASSRTPIEFGEEDNTFIIPSQTIRGANLFMVYGDSEYYIQPLLVDGISSARRINGMIATAHFATGQLYSGYVCEDGFVGYDCSDPVKIGSFQLEPKWNGDKYLIDFSTTLHFPVDSTDGFGPMFLRAIPVVKNDQELYHHQLAYNPNTRTISYKGELHNFTPPLTKYRLIFTAAPVTPPFSIDEANNHSVIESTFKKYSNTMDSPFNELQSGPIWNSPHDVLQQLFEALLSCDFQNIENCQPTVTLSSPLHTAKPLDTSPLTPSHSTTNPVLISSTGPVIDVTIPRIQDVPPNTSVTIQLKYYPLLTGSTTQYSTTPNNILTRTIILMLNGPTSIRLQLPTSLVSNKIFISLQYPTTVTSTVYATALFTTLASCYTPPSSSSNYNILSAWESICNKDGGVCSSITQKCVCNDGFAGITCSEKVYSCSHCTEGHFSSCTTDNQCVCTSEWSGVNCNVDKSCEKQNDRLCSNGGELAPKSPQGKCSDTCICQGNWIDRNCRTCSLQCFNNGLRYVNCDKCGCQAGFTGQYCECSGVDGKITINGYNELVIRYNELINSSNDNHHELSEITIAVNSIAESVKNILTQLLGMESNSVGITIHPVKPATPIQSIPIIELSSTEIRVSIIYGCSTYNNHLTRSQVSQRWKDMTTNLVGNDDLKTLFIFPVPPVIDISDDITDVEPTLPEGDDRLAEENYANLYTNTWLFITLTIFILLSVL